MGLNETTANLTVDGFVNVSESFSDNCSYDALFETTPPLSKSARTLGSIVPLICLLIGIPGNILTILVILRQRESMSSMGVYLFMLAISDTVFLVVGTFFDWLMSVFDLNIRGLSVVMCKLNEFLFVTCTQLSSWMLIAITIDRIIGIIWPHHYKRLCNALTAKVGGIAICVALCTLNAHFFYGYGNLKTDMITYYGVSCSPIDSDSYLNFYYEYWLWIDLTMYFVVPFVVLVVGNTIILARLIQMHNANTTGKPDTHRPSIRALSLLIVGLNVVFMISTMPLAVFQTLGRKLYDWQDEVMCSDPDEFQYRRGLLDLTFDTVLCLSYVNPSVNFILYVLSGTKFRNEIRALITCKLAGNVNAFG